MVAKTVWRGKMPNEVVRETKGVKGGILDTAHLKVVGKTQPAAKTVNSTSKVMSNIPRETMKMHITCPRPERERERERDSVR